MTQPPDNAFALTVRAEEGVAAALVCLAGDVDMVAAGALTDAADQLSGIAPAEVVVDLAEVTFACSTLPNFLDRLRRTLPAGTTLTLCRPTRNTRWVLDASGMDEIAVLREELPSNPAWPAAPR